MKPLCALVVACCVLWTTNFATAYESRGARSCAAWQEYRRDEKVGNPLNAQIYQTWVIGYLSGIVAGSGMDFLYGTDNESVFSMVDTYCGANLLMNLAAAGTYVARDLMQQKAIVNRGTLP